MQVCDRCGIEAGKCQHAYDLEGYATQDEVSYRRQARTVRWAVAVCLLSFIGAICLLVWPGI